MGLDGPEKFYPYWPVLKDILGDIMGETGSHTPTSTQSTPSYKPRDCPSVVSHANMPWEPAVTLRLCLGKVLGPSP